MNIDEALHGMKEEIRIPEGLSLRPFQIESVHRMLAMLRTHGGCYNACEPGLGKTIQSVVCARTLLPDLRPKILVICPAIMRLVWKEEIYKWWRGLPVAMVVDKRANLDTTAMLSHCIIVSYELAAAEASYLAEQSWDLLILDEAHYLKSAKAKRTKQLLRLLWPKAKYKICLSGTPFTNNVIDGYTLFHKLNPQAFPDFHSYAETYSKKQNTPWGPKYYGLKNVELLKRNIKSFFIRYTKEQVLKELPPKQFQRISLPVEYKVKMTKEQEDAHKRYLEDLKRILKSQNSRNIPNPPVSVMALRHDQGIKKVSAIIEFTKNLLEQNAPCVIFGIHRNVIEALETALSEYSPKVIHGETSSKDRQKAIEDFQGGVSNLFIGQLQAAGAGITLTRSSTVIFAELSYSPTDIAQACDRLHRIGQQNSVTVYYFTVKDSIDEEIAEIVMKKAKVFEEILG